MWMELEHTGGYSHPEQANPARDTVYMVDGVVCWELGVAVGARHAHCHQGTEGGHTEAGVWLARFMNRVWGEQVWLRVRNEADWGRIIWSGVIGQPVVAWWSVGTEGCRMAI